MQFFDHDGRINLSYGRSQLSVDRKEFLELEPEYSLPEGQQTRYWKKDSSGEIYWISDGANQTAATDFTPQQLADYCRKLAAYRTAIGEAND
jgi:hypothetical protein